MKRTKIGGVIPASITPFTEKGKVDGEALLNLMSWNMKQGADSFFIGGSSGECFLLTPDERKEVFSAASQLKEEAFLIAHVGAVSTTEAQDYARYVMGLGYDAIAATPPFYYGFSSREVCSYYHEIAQAAGKPVIIYNFPTNTGRHFDLSNPDYQALFRSEDIMGVKHTNQVVYQMERIRNLNPKLVILNGFDETMVAGMALGADGSIGSTFNFMYPHYKKIYDSYRAKELDQALELQVKANNIMNVLCDMGLIPSIKYVLNSMGIKAGNPRPPFQPLDQRQKEFIDRILRENLQQ